MIEQQNVLITEDEAKRYVIDCMVKVGCDPAHASALAENLVDADLRGHNSHGIMRIDWYLNDIKCGACNTHGTPKILKEKACTAWVDGQNILGPVVGNFCMDLAIQKAKQHGLGWVVCKGSNHFGFAGWYSLRAMEQNLVGLAFTNASPCAFPTRSNQCVLGTNPLSVAAGGENGDHFCLDMATTTVAAGKIDLHKARGNQELPKNWCADKTGHETRDLNALDNGGAMLPLGGEEITGGYKGYGLILMVEILCSMLSDAAWGPNIRDWQDLDDTKTANLGHCFIALDPSVFAPGFSSRMQGLLDSIRSLKPIDADKPVLVPGDPERKHTEKCKRLQAISYLKSVVENLNKISQEIGVADLRWVV